LIRSLLIWLIALTLLLAAAAVEFARKKKELNSIIGSQTIFVSKSDGIFFFRSK
jgi:hypothetical protein